MSSLRSSEIDSILVPSTIRIQKCPFLKGGFTAAIGLITSGGGLMFLKFVRSYCLLYGDVNPLTHILQTRHSLDQLFLQKFPKCVTDCSRGKRHFVQELLGCHTISPTASQNIEDDHLALSELHAFQFLGELFICHQLLFTYLSKLQIVKNYNTPTFAAISYINVSQCGVLYRGLPPRYILDLESAIDLLSSRGSM